MNKFSILNGGKSFSSETFEYYAVFTLCKKYI